MSVTSLDLNGQPWMVCDPENEEELETFIGNSGVDETAVTKRAPTPREAAKIVAERALRRMHGEEPDGLFGVSL